MRFEPATDGLTSRQRHLGARGAPLLGRLPHRIDVKRMRDVILRRFAGRRGRRTTIIRTNRKKTQAREVQNRSMAKSSIGNLVRPSMARSARISPTTLQNLYPWPEH